MSMDGYAEAPNGMISDFERLCAQLLEHTGDGVVLCDEDFRYVWANPAACAFMGYGLDELVGKGFLMNFPTRMHAAMTETYRAQLAGDVGVFSGTLKHRNGHEVDMTWSNLSFDWDGSRYGAAIFRPSNAQLRHPRAVTREPSVESSSAAEQIDVPLDRLARVGAENTRASFVALDLVDESNIIITGGRSRAIDGYAAVEQAISLAGGRIPFFDVWLSGRPVIISDAHSELSKDPLFAPLTALLDANFQWKGAVYIAIAHDGLALGGLSAYFPPGVVAPHDEEVALLESLADQAALIAEQTRLRNVSKRSAKLEERARLARDLHDSVNQALFSIKLHAAAALRTLDATPDVPLPALRSDLDALSQLTSDALSELRTLIFELRPEALEGAGLIDAIKVHAGAVSQRLGVTIDWAAPESLPPLAPETEAELYRIAVEALNNAGKHSGASTIGVAIADLEDFVQIRISDNGVGFDPLSAFAGHLGMTTMRERAAGIGADYTLRTAPGFGTTITATAPLTYREENPFDER